MTVVHLRASVELSLLVPLSKALHYASGDLSNFVFHACDEFIIYLSVQLVHPFYSCPKKIIRINYHCTNNKQFLNTQYLPVFDKNCDTTCTVTNY